MVRLLFDVFCSCLLSLLLFAVACWCVYVVFCVICVVRGLAFPVCRVLLVVCCLACLACCALLVRCCLLLVVCWLLSVGCV